VGLTRIPVDEIAHQTARQWIADHLRFVDPWRDVQIQSEIRPGSAELVDIFERGRVGANDTSAAVGYAPMSETERLCLAAEAFLNAPAFKVRHPEAGEDVKVMAVRRGRRVHLQVAVAFVDRFLPDIDAYFAAKEAIQGELTAELAAHLETLDGVSVELNTLDDRGRGAAGVYLTVTGTSAEAGDSGQVGRGNRVNGVIGVNRPMGTEAAAGKNPISHPGKVYTLLSHRLAQEIHRHLQPDGVAEVYVWLVSQIGRPLDSPQVVSVQLIPEPGRRLPNLTEPVSAVVNAELAGLETFSRRLALGELAVW
jgi:S-adenosylmethionine synthetase